MVLRPSPRQVCMEWQRLDRLLNTNEGETWILKHPQQQRSDNGDRFTCSLNVIQSVVGERYLVDDALTYTSRYILDSKPDQVFIDNSFFAGLFPNGAWNIKLSQENNNSKKENSLTLIRRKRRNKCKILSIKSLVVSMIR